MLFFVLILLKFMKQTRFCGILELLKERKRLKFVNLIFIFIKKYLMYFVLKNN